ncbi:MAG: hypothetical protein CR982_01370 [Candidatus Cloacimonadota bacterium]|nr:MAG: hypothetical protein CR982_01370 [Candidatus Cloacimonadota bacterium]
MKLGFTLIEVIVVSLLLSIALIGTTSLIAFSITTTAKVTAEERLQHEISTIMKRLKMDIRNGRKISVSSGVLKIEGITNDIFYEIKNNSLYRKENSVEEKLNKVIELDALKSSFHEDADIRARIVLLLTTVEKTIFKTSSVNSYVTCRNIY